MRKRISKTEESYGTKTLALAPEQLARPTDPESTGIREIFAALDPLFFGPYALFFKTRIVLSNLAGK